MAFSFLSRLSTRIVYSRMRCYRELVTIVAAIILSIPEQCFGQLPTTFNKAELISGLRNPVNFEFAPDGRIFILDRHGEIQVYNPDTQTRVSAGMLSVFHDMEDGLLGIAFDPEFSSNQYVYIHYSHPTLPKNRVSRFLMNGDQLDAASEVVVIEWTSDRNGYYHSAGDLDFDSEGNLFIAIGDNTNHSPYAALNESDKNQSAERSSSNTNDLRGKILRIKPEPDGTYTIPEGNLFPNGQGGRPEIYVMGARNPFKIFVDKQDNNWLFWGEVGPDANVESEQGPLGMDEINLVKSAGNYGWPYVSGNNRPYLSTYSNPKFYYDHTQPVNLSKWNTGAINLPPARPSWLNFFHGCYLAGPRYYFDASINNPRKLPSDFHQRFFYFDFNTSKIWAVKMDANGNIQSNQRFAEDIITGSGFIDLKIGPDGQLYILEYGAGCCPANVGTGKLVRVDYTGIDPNKAPVVNISASTISGPLPLEVSFSSEGTADPEAGPLTYEWDFDADGITDSNAPNPSFTYTTRGAFNALLRVTDNKDAISSASLTIYPGNAIANIIFNYPPEGGMFSWEDNVSYDFIVTDNEDGSTSNGSISCSDVNFVPSFGHLNHTHDGLTVHQCSGNFLLDPTSHDAQGQDNIYYSFNVSYRDQDGLTVYNQLTIFPKLMEAEFFNSQNNTVLVTNTDALGGGVHSVRALSDNAYIMLAKRDLFNIDSVQFRSASTTGCEIEVRADSPTGQLLATALIPATGGANRWANASASIVDPGGNHDLYFVFKKAGTINFVDLNYIEFRGAGISTDITPPHIYSIKALSPNEVSIRFNEPLDQASATNLSNYTLGNNIQVTSARLKEDGKTVRLFTSPLTVGMENDMTIRDIRNTSGVSLDEDIHTSFRLDESLIRINAGGPMVAIGESQWVASSFNSGGSSTSKPSLAIQNTTADVLYQSELNGNFTMNIPVPNPGLYNLTLHFAELVYKNVGERTFNVSIENDQFALLNYDIFQKVGFATAVTEFFANIRVDDGFLNVTFTGVSNKAKVSALEVSYGDNSTLNPSVTILNPTDGFRLTQPFDVNFRVENWWVYTGSSHIRLVVDGVPGDQICSTDPVTINNLPLGPHTIKLVLVSAAGEMTDWNHEISVEVVDDLCFENPFPLAWEEFVIGPNLPYRSPHIMSADIDGDGFLDIVTGGWWFVNPRLPRGTWIRNTIGSPVNNAFLVYDLDKDGDPDILGTHGTYLSTQLAWGENDGHGNFTIHTNIPEAAGFPPGSANNNTFLASCAVGNFDNVANIQLALVWNGSETTKAPVKMLTVPVHPANQAWTVYDAAPNAVGEAIVPVDIDGDGDLDLSQAKNWLRNNSGGSWTTFSTGITLATYYEHHWVGDLDRDGNLDGVMTQIGENQELTWFQVATIPTNVWTKSTLGTDVDSGLSLDVADLDSDGDLDVVTAEWKGEKRLIAFENDLCNSGTWIKHILHPGGTAAPDHHNGAQLADLDNDGDLDIISVGWDKRTPRIYYNNSSNSGNNSDPLVVNSITDQPATIGVQFLFTFPDNVFTDPDGDHLVYSAGLSNGDGLPSWLNFQGVQRTFQGTPPPGSSGDLGVRVTASDNKGGIATVEFVIVFTNSPPVVTNPIPDHTGYIDEVLNLAFAENTFNDPNGDPLTYTASLSGGSALPGWLTFSSGTRSFTGTPGIADAGTYTVVVRASDSYTVVDDLFNLLILDPDVNQPPVVSNPIPDMNATVGIPFSFTIPETTFSDPNGDSLVYSAALSDNNALPEWLSFDPVARTLSGTPGPDDSGAIGIVISASDQQEVSTLHFIISVGSAASIAINSGGEASMAYGSMFESDRNFIGGSAYTNNQIADIAGTTDDDIYRSERYKALSYQIPVPNGTYLLRLHFAEIYFGATGGGSGKAGSRVFNVNAEGAALLVNFDILAEVSAMTALIKTFEITVNDGIFNLDLIKVVQNPKISAVELIPLSTPMNQPPMLITPVAEQTGTVGMPFSYSFPITTFSDPDNDVLSYTARLSNGATLPSWLNFSSATRTFSGTPTQTGDILVEITASDNRGGVATDIFAILIGSNDPDPNPSQEAIRINSGGQGITVSGLAFGADAYYSGGAAYTNNNATEIDGTANDAIYGSERYKMTGYNVPVPPGTYLLRLHFAEIYFGAPGGGEGGIGKRVFDVTVEDALLLQSLDIYAEVGPVTALVKEFEIEVTDGMLNIAFTKVIQNPKVSAIEIIPVTSSARQGGESVARFPTEAAVSSQDIRSDALTVWPNPMTIFAVFEYRPIESGSVTLHVFDNLGVSIAEVFNGEVEGGSIYRYEFDASQLRSGIYFARLTRNRKTIFIKLVLTR